MDRNGRTSLQRMSRGYAPIGPDGEPMNLHHLLQTEDGALAEMTKSFHIANRNAIHVNPPTTPSGIVRPDFDVFRRRYWQRRAVDFHGE
jgi:hypothetical protein